MPFLSAWLGGCGAGTALIAASDNGGSENAPSGISAFRVESSKVSPAHIRFVLADPESNPVQVELLARVNDPQLGEEQTAALAAVELSANPTMLATSPQGVEYDVKWYFPDESSLPDDARFVEDVTVFAQLGGASQQLVEGGNSAAGGVGNDPPVILSIDRIDVDPDEDEASGTTGIQLTIADSSDDIVSVRCEFDIVGDVPDTGWRLARPDLLDPGAPPPDYGIDRVQVARAPGTSVAFHWDTAADLDDLERDVRLRFTPTDFDDAGEPVATGLALESSSFRVDNNAAPVVQLLNDVVISNPDEMLGIPVPFRVFDEEGDRVEVVFQWRAEDESFPALDVDADGRLTSAEIDAVLADPVARVEKHVCTPYPRYAEGLAVPVDEDTVRLPELASGESWILATGLEQRSLELLRPRSTLEPLSPTWSENPLATPIAALPFEDGLTALVLDAPGAGRIREIELASGAVVREIATLGPGTPSAMVAERSFGGPSALLVALDDAGTWRIERVELAGGAVTTIAVSDGSEPAPVRGMESCGASAVVFTAGSSLFQLDYGNPAAPRTVRVLAGLASPSGVVRDPQCPDRLYVAERGADRVIALDLVSRASTPVVVQNAALELVALEGPSALALENDGARLLVVTDVPGIGQQLVGIELGALGGNSSFEIGDAIASSGSGLAAGPVGLRLLCWPDENEILVGGGIEQRRVIASHSTSTQDVSVTAPFQPAPRANQPWRIPEDGHLQRTSALAQFLWDSSDARQGRVFLRAVARDSEPGLATDAAAPKTVRSALDVEPDVHGDFPNWMNDPRSVAIADLDADGDRDLVSASLEALTAHFQVEPGTFTDVPILGGSKGSFLNSAAVADMDGDGDLDVVAGGVHLLIVSQTSPGTFSDEPLIVASIGTDEDLFSCVLALDLDGDGDQDIAATNATYAFGGFPKVFLQLSPGNFAPPLLLGERAPWICAADLDGDGDQDLITASRETSTVLVYYQIAAGTFAQPPLVLAAPQFCDPSSVVPGDFDGDGDLDLAACFGEGIALHFQVSPGTFAPPLTVGTIGVGPWTSTIAASDLDADGDLDILSRADSSAKAFYQLSPGAFSEPVVVDSARGSLTMADLDGDGTNDLVCHDFDGLKIFYPRCATTLSTAPDDVGSTVPMSYWHGIVANDLDGDGDHDLVYGPGPSISYQQSPGRFAEPRGLPYFGGGSEFALADLDGDGDQDVAVDGAVDAEAVVRVFFQLSAGEFAAPVNLGASHLDTISDLIAADLDGDGDQDLAAAIPFLQFVAVFFQSSPGTFDDVPMLVGENVQGFNVGALAAADVDGDGDQDLLGTNFDHVRVFYQEAPGSFTTTRRIGDAPSPQAVMACDLDGDGDQDVIVVAATNRGDVDGHLEVFFQRGPRDFARPGLVLDYGPAFNPNSVVAVDVDADGDLDLVAANPIFPGSDPRGSNDVVVFPQRTPGVFGSPWSIVDPEESLFSPAVVVKDVDGDGDRDVVAGSPLRVFWGGR